MSKMSGNSENQQEEVLGLLREKLPEVFSEGKIDVKQLRATLGEEVLADAERYGLNWAGKTDCFRTIQETTTSTLKPVRDESVDFDNTENLFIEGDNLEVLKVLQKSYYGKVKMIYIDPPYNTGNDFIYNDKFSRNKREYLEEVGAIDKEGNVVNAGLYTQNTKDSGHFHSDWLNMMYPRLFLAKNLLRQDGVIFVSIDDNEIHNLRTAMNEIFGEENFVAQLTVLCNPKGRSQDKYFATNHEYMLCYSKTQLPKGYFAIEKDANQIADEYPEEDEGGKYRLLELRNTHREFGKHNRPNLYYPFFVDPSTGDIDLKKTLESVAVYPDWEDGFNGCWAWGKEKSGNESEFLFAKKVNEQWKIYRKAYASGAEKMLKSILNNKAYYTEKGQAVFNDLFETKTKLFPSPKSVELIKLVLKTVTEKDDIIVDFFAGSGSTAHATMQLNVEDGGDRKYICVQLPEKCKPETEAAKAGYTTITEIAKERIRRAGRKIQTENPDNSLDIGFKVFKIDESNFKIWNTHVTSVEQLEQQMIEMFDNVREGSTKEAMMYELILKSGKELNVAIEEKTAGGEKYFRVNDGSLVICLADKLSKELFTGILVDKPKKIIVLDKSFGNDDQLKTNLLLQAEGAGVDEVRVI